MLDVPGGEEFSAARGAGAERNGERIRVSSIQSPEFALVGTGFPFRNVSRLDEYLAQFARIAAATSGIRRPGAAAIDLAWVAAGRFDGFWEQRLAPWDIAAGALLVREAGGIVTDHGGSEDLLHDGVSVVAGNPVMHAWMRSVIEGGQADRRSGGREVD